MRFNNHRHLRYMCKGVLAWGVALACAWITCPAFGQNAASASAASSASASQQANLILKGPIRITMDEAIQLALQHNHTLLAARTAIEQSKDLEVTANFRPNPVLFADWEYLPLGSPAKQNPDIYTGVTTPSYLQNNTEGDIGLSYLIERGKKRQARYQAAKDQTAVTTSLVYDNERQLTFAVANLFVNAELAESTLELAELDLQSFTKTVEISKVSYEAGAISEDDYLKMELQLLQFQQDESQARLARIQALSDLRNQLGYESVPVNYDVANAFEYRPVRATLEDLQLKALQLRPDFQAAQQNVTAADSGYLLAKADGKQDVTVQGNYSHVNGINGASFLVSVPLAIFNRNQGEIARTRSVITQMQEQQRAANQQVMTDVNDAYQGLLQNQEIMQIYETGYLEEAKKDRDITEYAYQRGGLALLDFLDAERTYRSIELGYRQQLASWLVAVEQLREAVGTRALP
jgi:cobalt-zinc-cadmium efflux system outer membrane protein